MKNFLSPLKDTTSKGLIFSLFWIYLFISIIISFIEFKIWFEPSTKSYIILGIHAFLLPIILLIFLLFLTKKHLSNPMFKFSQAIKDFLDGKSETNIDGEFKGQFSDLAQSFNLMRNQLEKSQVDFNKFKKETQTSLDQAQDYSIETSEKVLNMVNLFEEQSIIKKELIHVLCHDLKNPLLAIQNIFSLLAINPIIIQGSLPDMEEKVKTSIEIIDLTKTMLETEVGKFNLDLKPYNLKELVSTSYSILKERFFEKNIFINIDIDPNQKVMVERVSFCNSVLNNLFTNATRFSEKNTTVEVNSTVVDGYIELHIKDNGIGIPQTLLNSVFDSLAYTVRPDLEGIVGTGNGLPLMKRFIVLYGGRIGMKSNDIENHPEDHGTEVTIKLKPA